MSNEGLIYRLRYGACHAVKNWEAADVIERQSQEIERLMVQIDSLKAVARQAKLMADLDRAFFGSQAE